MLAVGPFAAGCAAFGLGIAYTLGFGGYRVWSAEINDKRLGVDDKYPNLEAGLPTPGAAPGSLAWNYWLPWLSPSSKIAEVLAAPSDGPAASQIAEEESSVLNGTANDKNVISGDIQPAALHHARTLLSLVNYNVSHHAIAFTTSVTSLLVVLLLYYNQGYTIRADSVPAVYAPWVGWAMIMGVVTACQLNLMGVTNWIRILFPTVLAVLIPSLIALGSVTSSGGQWIFLAFGSVAWAVYGACIVYYGWFSSSSWSPLTSDAWRQMTKAIDGRIWALVGLFLTYFVLTLKLVIFVLAPEYSDAIASPMDAVMGEVIIDIIFVVFLIIFSALSRSAYEQLEMAYAMRVSVTISQMLESVNMNSMAFRFEQSGGGYGYRPSPFGRHPYKIQHPGMARHWPPGQQPQSRLPGLNVGGTGRRPGGH